jgi:transcriptional regulator with XRE-family HTH domain
LTQEELAGLVGISLSLMKKIESGARAVTKFSQLVLFAQALRVKDLRDLTGVPLPLMPDGVRGHPSADAVRGALMDRGPTTGEAPALDLLADQIEQAWEAWQTASAWRYAFVGQALPDLIRQTHAATRHYQGDDRRQALRQASRLYQLVRTWTKRVGEHELSLLAADRAVAAALDADDRDLAAAAAWNLAMIFSTQGRTEESRAIIGRAIGDLRPFMADANDQRLAVWGGLHLLGATEAARDERDTEAWRLLDTAERLAARTGETNHFRMVFGPTNVTLHRISTAIELGRVSDALDLAERVDVQPVRSVERQLTCHLEAARCYTIRRNDVAAVHMIQRIYGASAEELRFNVLVRETLRELMGRAKPGIQTDLGPLLAAASLPD